MTCGYYVSSCGYGLSMGWWYNLGMNEVKELPVGTLKNCENCKAQYGTYNIGKEVDSDWAEYWGEVPLHEKDGSLVEPKGLCQFCNKKSLYYNKG